jgi:hypothetical protein
MQKLSEDWEDLFLKQKIKVNSKAPPSSSSQRRKRDDLPFTPSQPTTQSSDVVPTSMDMSKDIKILKKVKKNDADNADDSKENRYFKAAGMKLHSWVIFNTETRKMHCNLCKKHNKMNAYSDPLVGAATLKIYALDKHSLSEDHIDAISKEVTLQSMERKANTLNSEQNTGLKQLFTLAYHVAKEHFAISKFEKEIRMIELLGLKIDIGFYRNPHEAKDIIECISQDLETQCIDRIRQDLIYSLILDESTDISTESHLVIYVKYFDEEMRKINTQFLKLLKLNAGDAKSIYDTVLSYMNTNQLSTIKLMGFGSDGCSTMLGSNKGVFTKLKEDNPFMLNNHCVMHRLQLCIKDLGELVIVQKVNDLVSDIYLHFCRSAKRSADLQSTQKEAGLPALQTPIL